MRHTAICSLLLGLLGAALPAAADTTIVVDRGSFPTVEAAATGEEQVNWLDADRADDTACTQCFAALELQRYLRRMTGRSEDFPVTDKAQVPPAGDLIFVGPLADQALLAREELAALGPEGYRIRSKPLGGRRVTIVAGAERVGTLYGAYDLLYRLGCRWFAPGEIGEDVPRVAAIPDVDVTERPSFAARGFLAWENRGDADFLLWMARNRLDYWTLAQEPRSLVHKLGIRMVCGRHTALHEFIAPGEAYPYHHARWPKSEGLPADPYPISPDFRGDADGDGVLSRFEAHPEWYALVKGQRVPGIRDERFGTNYCTSNADATTEFVTRYVQALVDGPYCEADIVRFWTLDGGKWCECDACRALGTPTDRYLLLVDRFCREIEKARAQGRIHRPIQVTFLTYYDVVEPPTRPLPAGFPGPDCMATFYPIRRCYVHPFDCPDCPANARYRGQLDGWMKDPDRYYRGPMAIGEYYNVSAFKGLPICFMHTMARDIPDYYRSGARTFDYMHVTTSRWGNKALTNYQMARQLWDVSTDCEALWRDYFARRYGPAAAVMRPFYESLEQMLSNADQLKYGLARRLDRGVEDLFPDPHLRYERQPGLESTGPTLLEMIEHGRRCRQLLSEALAMKLPAPVQARIAEDEQCFTYGEQTLAYYHACVRAFQEIRAGRPDDARPWQAAADRWAALLRADGISSQGSSSHGNADNALLASRAEHAPEHLAKALGPVDLKAEFLHLCDMACDELFDPDRKNAFYQDSYVVRALAAAYDMTGKAAYLQACRRWAERMVEFQREMTPRGAYYMHYGRKPGQAKGDWFVGDSSSIALGVLATAVRCPDPEQRKRLLDSVESYARLVIDNYVRDGGITDGLWSQFDGPWWCSTGIFGSLAFLLYDATGDETYRRAGLGTVDWLNRLDFDNVGGPISFEERPPTVVMYVLETYSTALGRLEPGSPRRQAAMVQFQKTLDWMAENQRGRVSGLTWDYNFHKKGTKFGGLPFHMYADAQYASDPAALRVAADQELRYIAGVLWKDGPPKLTQLAAFAMLSYAEKLNPGAVYRTRGNLDAGQRSPSE